MGAQLLVWVVMLSAEMVYWIAFASAIASPQSVMSILVVVVILCGVCAGWLGVLVA